jgi:hypothetical protein
MTEEHDEIWRQRFELDARRLAENETSPEWPCSIPPTMAGDLGDDLSPIGNPNPQSAEDARVNTADQIKWLVSDLEMREAAKQAFQRQQLEMELSGTLSEFQDARRRLIRAQMMDRDALETIPEPEPLIEGLLYKDSLSWIAGPSGTYKSFVALDIAARYSSKDMDFHGLPMAHGKALIVVGEGNGSYKRRVHAWEDYNQRDWPSDCIFHNGPIQLGDRDSIAALGDIISEDGYGLSIFDTQAMMTIGLDENRSMEMGVFVAGLNAIRAATGCCMCPVHHFPKNASGMRGSGAMYAAATTVVVTERDGKALKLSTMHKDEGKQKDGEEKEYPGFVMFEVGESLVLTTPLSLGADKPEPLPVAFRTWTLPILRVLDERDVHGSTQAEIRRWIEDDGMGKPNSGQITREVAKMIRDDLIMGGKTSLKITPAGRAALYQRAAPPPDDD